MNRRPLAATTRPAAVALIMGADNPPQPRRAALDLVRAVFLILVAVMVSAPAWAQSGQIVEYYHLDALGSVRVVTDQTGQVVARHDFLPFGEEWNPPANAKEKKLFTGHERDAETGLDYFGARYYRPQVGRFTTIDPVYTWSENLTDPQRWNRYAYAKDNPLRFIDTDGRSSIVFNGKDNRLYFFDKDGNLIGSWDATNRPSPELTIGRLADGVYDFLDTTTTRGFGDESPNSRLGTYGIFAVEPFMGEDGGMHTGVGIHSGRLNRGGYLWWTNGCIRTTDEAMMTIAYTAPSDPLTSLAVIDNRPANMDSFVLTQLAKMKIAF